MRLPYLLPLLLAACATSKAPSTLPAAPARAEAEPEPVELHYDWGGLDPEVQVTRARTAWSPKGLVKQEVELLYRLEAERKGDTVVLRPKQVTPRNDSPEDGDAIELLALELAQPDTVIEDDGNLRGIGGVVAAQGEVAALLTRLAKNGRMAEGLRGRVETVFGEEGIERRTRASWDRLVGFWSGGVLETGRVYQARERVEVEALGGIPVEMVYEISLRGRTPCRPGGADDCVILEMVARPDPAQDERLLTFVGSVFPDVMQPQEVRIEDRTTLITEPGTLRPHRYVTRRSVVVPFAPTGKGTPPSFEQTDEREVRYRWDRPAPAVAEKAD